MEMCGGCIMAIIVDGTAQGQISVAVSNYTSTMSTSTLSCTKSNNIIVVFIASEYRNQSTGTTISSVSGGSLTWNRRTTNYRQGDQSQEIWWAYSPGIFNSTITATFGGGPVDDATITAFGLNGANISSPWDTNISLPAKPAVNVSSAPISTNSSNPFVLCFYGSNTSSTPSGLVPSGNTSLVSTINGGAIYWQYSYIAGANVGVQNNITWGWTTSNTGSGNSSYTIIDAIAPASNSNFFNFL
jgi:hypothetical protein